METNVERTRQVWWWWAGLGAGLPGERLGLQNGHGIVLSLDFSPFPAVFSSEIPSAIPCTMLYCSVPSLGFSLCLPPTLPCKGVQVLGLSGRLSPSFSLCFLPVRPPTPISAPSTPAMSWPAFYIMASLSDHLLPLHCPTKHHLRGDSLLRC